MRKHLKQHETLKTFISKFQITHSVNYHQQNVSFNLKFKQICVHILKYTHNITQTLGSKQVYKAAKSENFNQRYAITCVNSNIEKILLLLLIQLIQPQPPLSIYRYLLPYVCVYTCKQDPNNNFMSTLICFNSI